MRRADPLTRHGSVGVPSGPPTDRATSQNGRNDLKRLAVPRRVRFEVFKRDSFTCQYCGEHAPNVVLEVDHIEPISKGGDQTSIINLITACKGCNSGKSNILISDQAACQKRKRQLDELQARREQIEMMAEWQQSLVDLTDQSVTLCASLWAKVSAPFALNETGLLRMRRLVLKFGISQVMEAIRLSANYLRSGADGKLTHESVEFALTKVGGICFVEKQSKDDPELHQLYSIKAMVLRKCPSIPAWRVLSDIKALRASQSLDVIGERLKSVERWGQYGEAIEDLKARMPRLAGA